MFNKLKKNCAVYKIRWKNVVQPERSLMTLWRMSVACWITKAKVRHLWYVILNDFPLQQWWHECNSMLRSTTLFVLVERTFIVAVTMRMSQLVQLNTWPCRKKRSTDLISVTTSTGSLWVLWARVVCCGLVWFASSGRPQLKAGIKQ
jgi:hypothetical protein